MVTWFDAVKVQKTTARIEVETLTGIGDLLDHRIRKNITLNFKSLVLTARCRAVFICSFVCFYEDSLNKVTRKIACQPFVVVETDKFL